MSLAWTGNRPFRMSMADSDGDCEWTPYVAVLGPTKWAPDDYGHPPQCAYAVVLRRPHCTSLFLPPNSARHIMQWGFDYKRRAEYTPDKLALKIVTEKMSWNLEVEHSVHVITEDEWKAVEVAVAENFSVLEGVPPERKMDISRITCVRKEGNAETPPAPPVAPVAGGGSPAGAEHSAQEQNAGGAGPSA